VNSLGITTYVITLTNKNSFIFSFTIYIPLIFFCCFTAIVRNFCMILNRSDERGHPCLVPELRGKVTSFSPLNLMLIIGFCFVLVDFFIKLRRILSSPSFLRVFSMNGC